MVTEKGLDSKRYYHSKARLLRRTARFGDFTVQQLRDGVIIWMVAVEWWRAKGLGDAIGGEKGVEEGDGDFEAA